MQRTLGFMEHYIHVVLTFEEYSCSNVALRDMPRGDCVSNAGVCNRQSTLVYMCFCQCECTPVVRLCVCVYVDPYMYNGIVLQVYV